VTELAIAWPLLGEPLQPREPGKRFQRLELKFLVQGASRRAVLRELEARLLPDPHGDGSGRYRVRSLYFDTPSFAIFRSRLAEPDAQHGVKLRIRTYGDEVGPNSAAMVEIKGKQSGATIKERVSLSLDDAYRLSNGLDPKHWDDPRDARLARQIAQFSRGLTLRPAAAIAYDRSAFAGKGLESGLRVTLDRRLTCRGPELRLDQEGPYQRFFPIDCAILELKASGELPLWIDRLIASHAEPRAVSKYVEAMQHLYGRP
jgi:SPX domain protein involved in polyphosphate accumulation